MESISSGIPASAQIVEAFDQTDDTIQDPSHQADRATFESIPSGTYRH
jgi:hypothetical protein